MANLKRRRLDPEASVDEYLAVFAPNIERLMFWLSEGYSVQCAKKKADITPFYHKQLLKCPEYAAFIYSYKQLSQSAIRILNRKIKNESMI